MGELDFGAVEDLVARAVAEDLQSGGDVTTLSTVPAGLRGRADAVPRTAGVVAGIPVAARVFELVGQGRITVDEVAADGTAVQPGDVLLTARGPVRDILTAERTALNLLCHLSGVATVTRAWVDAVAGTGAIDPGHP